jgi:hypothetical protein
MRISKNRVLDFLTKCQIEKGGYTGGDVAELAKSLPVSPQALSTFYRIVTNRKESLTAQQELQWLILYGINVADTYNLANARASLSTVFSYTDLKTFGGIDIEGIASRLQEAQKWFQQTYPDADPFEWFPRIRLRSKVIRNHLSRIKANESLADQALLIFEAQVDFIVRLKDILIN